MINYQLIDFYVLVCLMIDFHENLLLLVKISIFIICDFFNSHPASFYRDVELGDAANLLI